MKLEFTCILLRQHGSVDNRLKRSHPVFLVRLCLTRKQELAVRSHDGDPELPVRALNVWRKAIEGGVAAFFTPDKNLSPCVRILDTQTHHQDWIIRSVLQSVGSAPTRGSLKYASLLSSSVNHLFLKPSVCCGAEYQKKSDLRGRHKFQVCLQFNMFVLLNYKLSVLPLARSSPCSPPWWNSWLILAAAIKKSQTNACE